MRPGHSMQHGAPKLMLKELMPYRWRPGMREAAVQLWSQHRMPRGAQRSPLPRQGLIWWKGPQPGRSRCQQELSPGMDTSLKNSSPAGGAWISCRTLGTSQSALSPPLPSTKRWGEMRTSTIMKKVPYAVASALVCLPCSFLLFDVLSSHYDLGKQNVNAVQRACHAWPWYIVRGQ